MDSYQHERLEWSKGLPNTDIAILSAAHWFLGPIFIHRGDETLGCIYCNLPNMTQLGLDEEGFKLVYSAVFKHIGECEKCKEGLVTVLRTVTPSQFENGTWNTGGACSRTSPVTKGDHKAKKFGVLDVTKAMLMRPDGYPNGHWGNKWMKGYNDCVHWCLPGPIDAWNELLMAIIRQLR